mmetsp:Transcript_4835/g.8781  ORF Transcript_4835/g.8781 Transcript_4835/m.8781 type:complete len:87 (-) Transcript_4835:438-698(-)
MYHTCKIASPGPEAYGITMVEVESVSVSWVSLCPGHITRTTENGSQVCQKRSAKIKALSGDKLLLHSISRAHIFLGQSAGRVDGCL